MLDSTNDTTTSEECPICFGDPENLILISCDHSYCLSCFERSCLSAASTTKKDLFRVKCCGSGGSCSTVFTLQEIRSYLSTSSLGDFPQTSFEQHIQCHPSYFRYCPTPECGFIYRCPPEDQDSLPRVHTCLNCFEDICTHCHAKHDQQSCEDYQEMVSSRAEAHQKLKQELNIKDCPTCTTPMEKVDGCNHMICGGCKAHICWVCLAVFDTQELCYDHMNEAHGGNGLDDAYDLDDPDELSDLDEDGHWVVAQMILRDEIRRFGAPRGYPDDFIDEW